MPTNERKGRGFAGMDPDRLREISRKGGQASHGGGHRPAGTKQTPNPNAQKSK